MCITHLFAGVILAVQIVIVGCVMDNTGLPQTVQFPSGNQYPSMHVLAHQVQVLRNFRFFPSFS